MSGRARPAQEVHRRSAPVGAIDLLAGLWLLAAPFVLGYPRAYPHQRALVTDLLVGALVASLAFLHLRAWDEDRWASRGNLLLGLLLVALPVLFGYGSDPRITHAVYNDVITGLVIIAGATLSLAGSTSSR